MVSGDKLDCWLRKFVDDSIRGQKMKGSMVLGERDPWVTRRGEGHLKAELFP